MSMMQKFYNDMTFARSYCPENADAIINRLKEIYEEERDSTERGWKLQGELKARNEDNETLRQRLRSLETFIRTYDQAMTLTDVNSAFVMLQVARENVGELE
jgi:hypothetical protein